MPSMMNRRLAAQAALLSLCAVRAAPARAQDFPSRTVTLILPYPPGGGADVIARALAEGLQQRLQRAVIVEHRPGASGIVGTQAVANAPADGHTVLITVTQAALTNQFLFDKLPYDTRRDFAFISEVVAAPLVLVVNAEHPARTPQQLLDWAAQQRDTVSYGSWGAGSYPHMVGAYLARQRQLEFVHVPYRGEAPMLQELAAARLSFALASVASVKPLIAAGKLRALALMGRQRHAALPELPTFAETGMVDEELRAEGWLGLMVPAATPAPVVQRLEREVQAVARQPELQARFAPLGFRIVGSSGAEFRQHYEQDLPVLQRLVKVSGARVN